MKKKKKRKSLKLILRVCLDIFKIHIPSNNIDSARQRTQEVGSYHEMQIWSTEAQRINIIPWVSQTNAVKLCLRRPAGRAREKQSALDTLSLVSNHTDTLVCHLKFNSEIFTPSGTRRCRWRCLYALTESGFLIHFPMKYIWQK